MYELELYTQESKKFPPKGSIVDVKGGNVSGCVFSFNIMSNEVSLRTSDGENFRIPVSQVKSVRQRNAQDKKEEGKGKPSREPSRDRKSV